jgi:outer membrane protein TolC
MTGKFMKKLPFILFLIGLLQLNAQETLSYKEYIAHVIMKHPIMLQADLQVDLSEANLRLERGIMDPYVAYNYGDKAYDNKDYYEKQSFKIALPTALGVELFAGYAENTGGQVNPELITSASGQYQAGISMPLGTKLLFNEKQLAIRQADLMMDMAAEQKRIIINDLLYRASLAYLNWSLSAELLFVQENALEISNEQFQFVKQVFIGGDRPAIDTVEAFLQAQNRQFQLLEAQNMIFSAQQVLSNFLWDDEGNPLVPAQAILPEPLAALEKDFGNVQDSFLVWDQLLIETHPELAIKRIGIEALGIEKRTAISNTLPQLDVKYAALSPGIGNADLEAIGINDRMFAVGIKYPLLLRKERAKLSAVNIKTLEKTLDLDVKQLSLRNKLNEQVFAFETNAQQAALYTRMTQNYSTLLEAEKTKFAIGESSVFLLNSRENKLFDAQAKLYETRAKQTGTAFKVIQTANQESYYLKLINE